MIAGLITVVIQALLEGGILIFFMIVIGNLSFTMLLILPLFALMACFAFGVGLVLGLMNIRYRDVFYLHYPKVYYLVLNPYERIQECVSPLNDQLTTCLFG